MQNTTDKLNGYPTILIDISFAVSIFSYRLITLLNVAYYGYDEPILR